MFFHQRFVPALSIMSYVIGDEKTGQAAVIDPTRDVEDYLSVAREQGLTIAHILEHFFHLLLADPVRACDRAGAIQGG